MMEAIVQDKLLKAIAMFVGYKLSNARLMEKTLRSGKEALLVELEFEDAIGQNTTMVLALDQEITKADDESQYEELVT